MNIHEMVSVSALTNQIASSIIKCVDSVIGESNLKFERIIGPYTPIFLIHRTLLLSFKCGACSISAIGESNGKSQLAKYFQNSYALESYGG